MTTVAIIDYGSGNLRSAAKAFERAAKERGRKERIIVTADASTVRAADRIVLPGVGAFADCMRGLSGLPGMIEALEDAVVRRGRAMLGICVGMQLLAERGLEHGTHRGLGWIKGDVAMIEPVDQNLRVPHMGWNELDLCAPIHPVFAGIGQGAHVYFVHSYGFRGCVPAETLAVVDYGGRLVAAVGRDNIVGTQFHPEKSQEAGLRLIANFLDWSP